MTLTGLCRTLAPVALLTLACSDPSAPSASTKLEKLPRDLSVAEKSLISGSNAFAFELLREINADQRTENVFILSLSASMALGMTLNGAAGGTLDPCREPPTRRGNPGGNHPRVQVPLNYLWVLTSH